MHSRSQRSAGVTAWESVLLSVVLRKCTSPHGISHGHNILVDGSLPGTAMDTEVGSH